MRLSKIRQKLYACPLTTKKDMQQFYQGILDLFEVSGLRLMLQKDFLSSFIKIIALTNKLSKEKSYKNKYFLYLASKVFERHLKQLYGTHLKEIMKILAFQHIWFQQINEYWFQQIRKYLSKHIESRFTINQCFLDKNKAFQPQIEKQEKPNFILISNNNGFGYQQRKKLQIQQKVIGILNIGGGFIYLSGFSMKELPLLKLFRWLICIQQLLQKQASPQQYFIHYEIIKKYHQNDELYVRILLQPLTNRLFVQKKQPKQQFTYNKIKFYIPTQVNKNVIYICQKGQIFFSLILKIYSYYHHKKQNKKNNSKSKLKVYITIKQRYQTIKQSNQNIFEIISQINKNIITDQLSTQMKESLPKVKSGTIPSKIDSFIGPSIIAHPYYYINTSQTQQMIIFKNDQKQKTKIEKFLKSLKDNLIPFYEYNRKGMILIGKNKSDPLDQILKSANIDTIFKSIKISKKMKIKQKDKKIQKQIRKKLQQKFSNCQGLKSKNQRSYLLLTFTKIQKCLFVYQLLIDKNYSSEQIEFCGVKNKN